MIRQHSRDFEIHRRGAWHMTIRMIFLVSGCTAALLAGQGGVCKDPQGLATAKTAALPNANRGPKHDRYGRGTPGSGILTGNIERLRKLVPSDFAGTPRSAMASAAWGDIRCVGQFGSAGQAADEIVNRSFNDGHSALPRPLLPDSL